jgi:hypothetical protein
MPPKFTKAYFGEETGRKQKRKKQMYQIRVFPNSLITTVLHLRRRRPNTPPTARGSSAPSLTPGDTTGTPNTTGTHQRGSLGVGLTARRTTVPVTVPARCARAPVLTQATGSLAPFRASRCGVPHVIGGVLMFNVSGGRPPTVLSGCKKKQFKILKSKSLDTAIPW